MSLLNGDVFDVLPTLESESVQMCVTSPPYWGLRDYGVDGQIGLESMPEEFVAKMVAVFREVRRVLKEDGTLWLNLGDSYASGGRSAYDASADNLGQQGIHSGKQRPDTPTSLRPKDLIGMPWRVAFALQADGWCLRQDIIWHKPNPMPESVTDRCTKAHEYMFLLSKSARYWFDADAIREKTGNELSWEEYEEKKETTWASGMTVGMHAGSLKTGGRCTHPNGRNKRSVWTVNSQPFSEAHFATFPKNLIEPCILAGSRPGDVVLDPFFGSGTTGEVCERLGRQWLGIELNPEYCDISKRRTAQQGFIF